MSGKYDTDAMVMLGTLSGVEYTITAILIADVYGRRALGSVNGIVAALGTAASGLGSVCVLYVISLSLRVMV